MTARKSEERLDTAHQVWERRWSQPDERARWSKPEPVVTGFIASLQRRGASLVVDVGTGVGRHALAYARAGLGVLATDASPTGIGQLARSARTEGLGLDTAIAPFTALPLEDASVDHVLAWNVIYHGDRAVAASALAEFRRVLRPAGTLQMTMLSKRHRAYGVGRRIRPDTFVDDAGTGEDHPDTGDKHHPHFYVDGAGLAVLLADAGFEVLSMVDVDQEPPRGWHWVVLAETAPPRRA